MGGPRIPCHFRTASQVFKRFKRVYKLSLASQPALVSSQCRLFSSHSIPRATQPSTVKSTVSPVVTTPQGSPEQTSAKDESAKSFALTERRRSEAPERPMRGAMHEHPRSPGQLAGKRCMITGASQGIGRAIAKRFAEEGARCLLVGRNQEMLNRVAAAIQPHEALSHEKGFKRSHRVVLGDVRKEEFWQEFKKDNIDILVNCAGVAHYSPLVTTSSASMEQMLQTNLMGTMLGCKIVGKRMMKNREGCIINVASLLGLKGGMGSAAYAASKAGVIAFTRALAAELGDKDVRVNVIVPGYITTGMTKAMTPEAHSAALNAIPLKRFGEPAEIADAALFLALNKYASNCVLNLDGGLSAT